MRSANKIFFNFIKLKIFKHYVFKFEGGNDLCQNFDLKNYFIGENDREY